jgi:hypothetical protein
MAGAVVDYPSSEILLQRSFLLLAQSFGPTDRRTQQAVRRLMECYGGYAAQHVESRTCEDRLGASRTR